MSQRLDIQKALAAVLSRIDVLAADQVFRGRLLFGDNDPLPRVSILESPKTSIISYPEGDSAQKEEWELYLQGTVDNNIMNPTDPAHELLVKVKQALVGVRTEGSSDYQLGGLVFDIGIDGGICRPPDEHSPQCYFLLNIKFSFIEELGNI